jgi:hypothetical protein
MEDSLDKLVWNAIDKDITISEGLSSSVLPLPVVE